MTTLNIAQRERERESERKKRCRNISKVDRDPITLEESKEIFPSIIPDKYNVYSNKEVPTFTARRKYLPG